MVDLTRSVFHEIKILFRSSTKYVVDQNDIDLDLDIDYDYQDWLPNSRPLVVMLRQYFVKFGVNISLVISRVARAHCLQNSGWIQCSEFSLPQD